MAILRDESGARIVDCGVHAAGGIEAGRLLAETCLAGLGRVTLATGDASVWPGPAVMVSTDHPVAACMASQYAGWQIVGERYFAMGSGPMRALRGREPLLEQLGAQEHGDAAVGVLESGKLPPPAVCRHIADECHVDPENLTLLVAPTASLAGTIQVVARSVETALHKMHELGLDLTQVHSGWGVAPLPPVAADDLAGIGRTNDAILYGGQVTLWLEGDDQQLSEYGPRIPSCASADFGEPFAAVYERYGRDFYRIDPLLFSPAVVTLVNLGTGRVHRFGKVLPDVLRQSFER